jgi:hypothetical protein
LSGQVESIDEDALKAAEKIAEEELAKMHIDRKALENDSITLPTPESMHSGLAASLYTEYKR